jgi:hypothetical protein
MKPLFTPGFRLIFGAALALSPAGCAPSASDFGFAAPVDLLAASTPDAPAYTANVVASGAGPRGAELLVTQPVDGAVLELTGCDTSCSIRSIHEGLGTPVRAVKADLDGHGATSLLVADIGSLTADETLLGRLLAVDAEGRVTTILDGLGRTACAHPADLDGDGDVDVLGCVFGSTKGELMWAERRPDGSYAHRIIDAVAGASDAFAFDADGDGDLDVAAAISQDTEEVRFYRNDGRGNFTREVLFAGEDPCYGLSGLALADLDHDGDLDLLVTNGDDMDEECHGASYRGQHGLAWLENDGAGHFTHHDLLRIYGAYAARAADLDGDGDLDLVLASYSWDPTYSTEAGWSALLWMENDGDQRFSRHDIAGAPAAVITLDLADVDRDGVLDLVTGSMNGEHPMPGARPLTWLRGHHGAR